MIVSFKNEQTREIYETGRSRKFGNVVRQVIRRLNDLDIATKLNDLRASPGNRLEKLQGERAGEYSIRINDQFRICFRWEKDGAHEVELVDYH
jgi:proteic killer suppression protein